MEERVIPTVQLGGRMWQMRIGHKVLQKFSALTRVGMDSMGALLNRYDMTVLLLWCIISEQDPGVRRETLDDWLDELSIREWQKLMSQVGESIAASFPDDEETEEETGEKVVTADGQVMTGGAPDPTGAVT